MKPLLLIFSLVFIRGGSGTVQWEKIDKFQQFFKANEIDVEKIIESSLDAMNKTLSSASDTYEMIEEWPVPWENTPLPENNCTFRFPKKINIKQQFMTHLRLLEEPVMKRIGYLREKLSEISSSISILVDMAHFKNRSCSLSSDNCTQKIDSWIEENISDLMCKIVKNCQEHVITKRSIRGCSTDEFMCRNGECIAMNNVCTGTRTCSDGSDEGPQCTKYCFNGFHCTTLKCIDKLLICDGKDDCGDNSDEIGCPYQPKNCSEDAGMYLCLNKRCVSLEEVCDGSDGCGDGSDEGGMCGQGCPGRCEDINGVCLTTPRGPFCLNKCPAGYADTASGCRPLPEVLPTTLEELLEEMPKVVERLISSIYQLKLGTFSLLTKASEDYSKCYNGVSLNKIIRLTNFNETSYSNKTYKLNN